MQVFADAKLRVSGIGTLGYVPIVMLSYTKIVPYNIPNATHRPSMGMKPSEKCAHLV